MAKVTYKRDPGFIKSVLHTEKNSNQVIAKEDISVIFPKTWENSNLSSYDENLSVVGYLGWFCKNKYSITMVPNLMPFSPNDLSNIKVDDNDYVVMKFYKGSVVVPNTNLAMDDKLVYYVYDELIGLGKTPFYFSYFDIFSILSYIKKYANVDLKTNPAILEMLSANRGRLRSNLSELLREKIIKPSDINDDIVLDLDVNIASDEFGMVNSKLDYVMIAFKNVALGATNFVSRSIGAYADRGLTAQLIAEPEKEIEEFEELLKS